MICAGRLHRNARNAENYWLTVVQVFASVVPDLIQGRNALPGNDTITVGNGNDVIFGDFGLIAALPSTGISQIDAQLQGLSVTMMGLLTQFSALSTAQDALNIAEGNSTAPFTISAGDDHITVGNGNDTVFGDDGEYLVPGVAFAQGTGSLASNAVALDTYLLEMQEVFADMSYVVNQAGLAVISSFATATTFSGVYNPAAALRAATHQLNLGNDVIIDGSGTDLVIGDDGFVIMPGVGTPTSNWTNGVAGATLQSVQQQLQQLETTFDATLKSQLAADHPFTASDSAAAQYLFNGGTGFLLAIGNDQISGGAGNSILIGDNGVVLDPVLAAGVSGPSNSNALQAIMATAVDRLFLGPTSTASAYGESWGVVASLYASGATDWSSGGGYVFNDPNKSQIQIDSDTITSGSGSDVIDGDMGVVLPQLGSSPGVGSGFYTYPVDETGETSTANYNYAYGFGPFGSLQQWSSDPGAPSKYTVDADTITGGTGNNVIFGELGDDTITGGAGNDQISGGYGFNTVSGGGGTNQVVFNRNTDTHVAGGGTDISRTSLNVTAGSSILSGSWQSITGTTLAAGMGVPLNTVTWFGSAADSRMIQIDGSTALEEVGNNYEIDNIGGSIVTLKYSGSNIVQGEFGAAVPIGAVQTANGYDLVFKIPGSDEFTVWNIDSSGNYISNLIGDVSGSSSTLEAFEVTFNQDLNGDGVIGIPAVPQGGTMTVVQVGNNYYLDNTGGASVSLKFSNSNVVVGQFGAWIPVAAVQAGNGYDVAFELLGADEFTVWSTDSSGNYISNLIGDVPGSSSTLEAFEVTFNQDLNGDHVIGDPAVPQGGTETVVQVGNNYYLDNSGGTSITLKFSNSNVVVGQFGAAIPVAAVQSGNGYDVAFEIPGSDEFTVWSTDSSGNYISNLIGDVPGSSSTLEAFEVTFNQDLNGDHVIGDPTVPQGGTEVVVQVGNNYYLNNSGGSSITLKFANSNVVVGQFGAAIPVAAVQSGNGYDVAFEIPGSGEYTIWSTDSNGNYISNIIGDVTGTSSTLETYEVTFNQDLNGDGVIGPVVTSAATFELPSAYTGPVTFAASTGTLQLDQSVAFGGQVFNFTGTGNLASSDVIDLRDVAYAAGTTTESYSGTNSGGTLTVSDAQHHTASILFSGNYLSSTFTLSSDGHGGTFVIDPPIEQTLSGSVSIASDAVVTGAQTIKISSQNSELGNAEGFMPIVVNAPNAQSAAAGETNADPNSVGRTVTQSYNVPLGGAQSSRANTAVVHSAVSVTKRHSDDYPATLVLGSPVIGSGIVGISDDKLDPSTAETPAADNAAVGGDVVPANAFQREIVLPRDLIRAVGDGNIAIKVGDGLGERAHRQVWLFDDAGGDFVAPDPEPLTIVIDRADLPVAPTHHEHSLGVVTTAAVIAAGPSWLGVLRQFGRKAALAVQQRAKWTE